MKEPIKLLPQTPKQFPKCDKLWCENRRISNKHKYCLEHTNPDRHKIKSQYKRRKKKNGI